MAVDNEKESDRGGDDARGPNTASDSIPLLLRRRLRKSKDPDEHDDQNDYSTEHDLVVNLSFAAAHVFLG